MKIKGREIKGPNIEIIVIPRLGPDGESSDIVFRAQAVLDFDDFDKLCPRPKAPQMLKRGHGMIENPEDPRYKSELKEWGEKRINWIIITSLRATEGLEWDQVKYDNPSTWRLYDKELRDSGFGQYEIQRIITGVWSANSLDEDKVDQARKRFLAGQEAELKESSSRNGETRSTLSGESVNG